MLYLIKQYGKNREFLKIGYSKNIEDRLKQYNTHSAETKLIDTFEGTQKEEAILQSILSKYIIHNEWMEYNDEIINLWKLYKVLYPELKRLYKDKIETLTNQLIQYKKVCDELAEINRNLLSKLI